MFRTQLLASLLNGFQFAESKSTTNTSLRGQAELESDAFPHPGQLAVPVSEALLKEEQVPPTRFPVNVVPVVEVIRTW